MVRRRSRSARLPRPAGERDYVGMLGAAASLRLLEALDKLYGVPAAVVDELTKGPLTAAQRQTPGTVIIRKRRFNYLWACAQVMDRLAWRLETEAQITAGAALEPEVERGEPSMRGYLLFQRAMAALAVADGEDPYRWLLSLGGIRQLERRLRPPILAIIAAAEPPPDFDYLFEPPPRRRTR